MSSLSACPENLRSVCTVTCLLRYTSRAGTEAPGLQLDEADFCQYYRFLERTKTGKKGTFRKQAVRRGSCREEHVGSGGSERQRLGRAR